MPFPASPSLAYAPGKVYLAGPYKGAPLSLAIVAPGLAGPFDLGNVLVRVALRVDPETAEVFLDATGSDPTPHIVQGQGRSSQAIPSLSASSR